MSDIAVRVENLGKMYRIGGPQEKYVTLRDTISSAAIAPFRKVRGLMRGESASGLKEEIWALKDVSFEVKHGEVIGIIGRNGAGKSTLLKVLSRITEPTTGCAHIYGRVGALLEVGTGFHPELTGRENVYLNGAILGMSRNDIERKFDEIVDFAGVEKFIDTPVKHYSSGMGLRLGFAVAAYLEPEILVVDEVLAVGDTQFQKKCLGKMSSVANEGRTVLFVSHNMAAVSNLCPKSILLESGTLRSFDTTPSAIQKYLKTPSATNIDLSERSDRRGTGQIRFKRLSIVNEQGVETTTLQSAERVSFEIEYTDQGLEPEAIIWITLKIYDQYQQLLFTLSSHVADQVFTLSSNLSKMICVVPKLPLVAGHYSVTLWAAVNKQTADRIESAIEFSVDSGDFFGTGKTLERRYDGNFLVAQHWC